MGSREVDIRLVVKDDGTIVLNQAGKKIEHFSRKGKSDLSSMFNTYDQLQSKIMTLGGALVLKEAVEGVVNMGKLGAEVKNVTNAFQRIDGSADLMVRLKNATKGGISELELMRNALVGIDLGATNQQLETFARFARFESVRKGSGELEVFQNILSGVLRGSTELLDNFGISLTELNSRLASMAAAAGGSLSKLTDVERRQLAVAAATDIMKERLDALGDSPVTDAEKINQAAVAWEDLSNNISTIASPVVADAMQGISTWLNDQITSWRQLKEEGYGDLAALIIAATENSPIPGSELRAKLFRSIFTQEEIIKPVGGGGGFGGGGGGMDGDPVFSPSPKRTIKPPPKPPPTTKIKAAKEDGWVLGPDGWVNIQSSGLGYQDKDKTGRVDVGRTFEVFPGGQSGGQRKAGSDEFPLIGKMDDVADKFENTFSEGQQLALDMTSAVGNAFMAMGSQIGSEFDVLWGKLFNNGKTVFDRMAISFLSSFTSSIAQIVAKFAAMSVMNAIIPGSGALLGGLFGRAAGGPVAAQQPYIVGERGPEVFVPQQNGRIVPNVNFADTINVQGFIPEEMMQVISRRRSIQRDELIELIRSIKSLNRMPA